MKFLRLIGTGPRIALLVLPFIIAAHIAVFALSPDFAATPFAYPLILMVTVGIPGGLILAGLHRWSVLSPLAD